MIFALPLAALLTGCAGDTAEPPATTSSVGAAVDAPAGSQTSAWRSAEEIVPESGALFGVSLDWSEDSLADYADRLGRRPAVAVSFYGFPMEEQERTWLDQAVEQAAEVGSILLLTLEPRSGLAAVTGEVATDLAGVLDGYNRRGVPTLVRFAHEMNGSWYSWGQQPAAYVAAYRRVAAAIHRDAPGSAMVWAPNYGGGYPFAGGEHQAEAGSAAARALDTDGDGVVTQADDPYRPYWPGRAHVDWVGMSVYHWGAEYPWGENEVPEPTKFTDLIRGTYDGAAGDERAVPDFYAEYGEQERLPLAVTETAAFHAPGGSGAGEMAVKQAWWGQVFDDDHVATMPWLKMINWFDWRKHEPETDAVVDWTVTRSPDVAAAFRADLPDWLHFAG